MDRLDREELRENPAGKAQLVWQAVQEKLGLTDLMEIREGEESRV